MNSNTFTVSELTRKIKDVLESSLAPVWVTGEISNYKHHSSGHRYFSLKDSSAQLRCVMFRSAAGHLAFEPEHGFAVRAYGRIGVWPPQGTYQLYVEKLEPAGLGALHQAFEALKLKLQSEGLFEPDLKKPLPRFPRVIGIVTSPTGAVIRDIYNVIARRFPLVRLLLFPVRVQGSGAAAEIAGGIQWFNRQPPGPSRPDVLIVGRGGGSLEDLWPFNEETTARAIFQSHIPVISAVGHETDMTISDFVADHRAPTPSAAGELAVPDASVLKSALIEMVYQLQRHLEYRLELLRLRLDKRCSSGLFRPGSYIQEQLMAVDHIQDTFAEGAVRQLQQLHRTLESSHRRLAVAGPQLRLASARNRLLQVKHRLESGAAGDMDRWKRALEKISRTITSWNPGEYRSRLDVIRTQLEGKDPRKRLQEGYALCMTPDGRLITSSRDIDIDDSLTVNLGEGELDCQVMDRRLP